MLLQPGTFTEQSSISVVTAMKLHVISAIFRRNFLSYFSNPTGYVFICVFVLLNSFAAFWPNEFFNSNLANLDQLNRYLPYILLVFIPAITMSIWAEERRQGTDELLLTIPAGDFEVVLGKYLAAVAIYSVSLLFSLICNRTVFWFLGSPDTGLFLGTYFGYWMVGLAMLAIGMVASFLTGNLTVGFVLGALFNAPLVFAANADVILASETAMQVKSWSLEEQFRDFGRGVISLSSVTYFATILAVMLYLSMVLISRRHWAGGREGKVLGGHYFVRSAALLVAAVGAVMIFRQFDLRADVTSEQLSSLLPQTRKLISELDPKRPVRVDAYVSPDVPEIYVQTRLDLLSMLREMDAMGGSTVHVRVHNTMPLSVEAEQAEEQFGITGRQVLTRSRGAISREEIYLGVAFTAGLDKVVVPFFDRGIPVEYELIRSIGTVSQQQRKKIGVLTTDARLFGGMDFQTFQQTRNELLIDELEKQYEVVQVSPDSPITTDVDALLAVQPSSLGPQQMDNFVEAVKGGLPTAIFEDPLPVALPVPGTSAPKRPPPQMSMMGMNQPPQPKGDIGKLWKLLGVDFSATNIVWQNYNPVPKLQSIVSPEWVFVDEGAGGNKAGFNQGSQISSKLQQLLFLFPGSVAGLNASSLKFDALVQTGDVTGTVAYDEIMQPTMFGGGGGLNPRRRFVSKQDNFVLAAHIHGKLKAENLPMSDAEPLSDDEADGDQDAKAKVDGEDEDAQDEDAGDNEAKDGGEEDQEDADKDGDDEGEGDEVAKKTGRQGEINVVLVSDIDMLHSDLFMLRAQGNDPDRDFNLNLDNVTFILNVLDVLAGDERFVEIRKRRPKHRTLEAIEVRTKKAREQALEKQTQFDEELQKEKAEADAQFAKEIQRLQERKNIPQMEMLQRVAEAQEIGQQRLQAKKDQLQKKHDKEVDRIERNLALEINRVQDSYKKWAVLLPPIPPLLVGLGVYFNRRAREREGVSRARLR